MWNNCLIRRLWKFANKTKVVCRLYVHYLKVDCPILKGFLWLFFEHHMGRVDQIHFYSSTSEISLLANHLKESGLLHYQGSDTGGKPL